MFLNLCASDLINCGFSLYFVTLYVETFLNLCASDVINDGDLVQITVLSRDVLEYTLMNLQSVFLVRCKSVKCNCSDSLSLLLAV